MKISNNKSDNPGARKHVRARACAACFLALMVFAGCAAAPAKKAPLTPAAVPATDPSGSDGMQELNLLSMPMALNLDANPGADGIAVKVFANDASSRKTVAIEEGKIEILMFDGVVDVAAGGVPPTLHVWTFTPAELKPFVFNKSIGAGYDLILTWGTDQPQKNRVTVIARHVSNKGKTVYSGPVTVTVSSF